MDDHVPPARVIDHVFDFSKYRFHRWADGNIYVLTQGEHFECMPETYLKNAREWGQKNMLHVQGTVLHSKGQAHLAIQYTDLTGKNFKREPTKRS